MKTLLTIAFLVLTTHLMGSKDPETIVGGWEYKGKDHVEVRIYAKAFFAVAVYNVEAKQFSYTYGGKYQQSGDQITEWIEFDTRQPENVGKERKWEGSVANDKLVLRSPEAMEFKRLDSGGPGQLSGAWLITGRVRDNHLQRSTPGARRTMKILSGTRFQWIAYNVETKEFFGTGGGNYTTVDGKYTESIDFFSRDATRVGMSLVFDFSLENGEWRHKGLSSKGDPIDEVWTQREKVGL